MRHALPFVLTTRALPRATSSAASAPSRETHAVRTRNGSTLFEKHCKL